MAVHTSSCSCHPGIPPLDDARFAGRGRVTSPAVCSAGQLPALNVSLIWRSATQSSEPLNPNTRLHFGNLAERGVQNGGSAKTAQSVRRPPGNLGQRAPSQPLQDNISQSTSRRGLRPRRTWGHLSPGPCRMQASLSDHEVLDSAGAVREVVGNGGSGHRFRAEIWVREEDACVQGGGC